MMMCRIGHGNLVTVARDDVFIVLRAAQGSEPVDKELGVHLWHALGQERGIQKVLSLLAQQGLNAMPEFALVKHKQNALHVIVRGTFNVLILNHDGRYSSVGSDGAATWREYAELPAAEFCIRGVPGLTIRGTEEFYLASGVTRVATICSLGWDDPEHPTSLVEERETGDIAPVELGGIPNEPMAAHPAGTVEQADPAHAVDADQPSEPNQPQEPEPHEVPSPLVEKQEDLPDDMAESDPKVTQVIDTETLAEFARAAAHAEPQPPTVEDPELGSEEQERYSAPDHTPTEVFQVPATLEVAENVRDQSSAPSSLSAPSSYSAPSPHDSEQEVPLPSAPVIAPVPAPPADDAPTDDAPTDAPRSRRVLQPLMDSQTYMPAAVGGPVNEDSDTQSTLLTSNLVELRAQMAEGDATATAALEQVVPAPPAPVPTIRMNNGVRIPLDRTILLGRAPQAARLSLRDLPRLVNVASPNNDVSRTHAQVRIEGDFVLVTDLNSTNGVLLTEPGQPPRRLHPDEPAQLQAGVIVDLGDGVTFELEDTP